MLYLCNIENICKHNQKIENESHWTRTLIKMEQKK